MGIKLIPIAYIGQSFLQHWPCLNVKQPCSVKFLQQTPEDGAQTPIYCAVSEEIEGITGKYFSECEVAKEGNAAKDDAVPRKLWEASEKLTGLKSA